MSASSGVIPHPALIAHVRDQLGPAVFVDDETISAALVRHVLGVQLGTILGRACRQAWDLRASLIHAWEAADVELRATPEPAEPDYTLSDTWRLVGAVLSLSQRAQGALLDQHGYSAIVSAVADLTTLADKTNAELRKLGLG